MIFLVRSTIYIILKTRGKGKYNFILKETQIKQINRVRVQTVVTLTKVVRRNQILITYQRLLRRKLHVTSSLRASSLCPQTSCCCWVFFIMKLLVNLPVLTFMLGCNFCSAKIKLYTVKPVSSFQFSVPVYMHEPYINTLI